jgi:hypothetical protein
MRSWAKPPRTTAPPIALAGPRPAVIAIAEESGLIAALNAAGLDPAMLVVEITESAVVRDVGQGRILGEAIVMNYKTRAWMHVPCSINCNARHRAG